MLSIFAAATISTLALAVAAKESCISDQRYTLTMSLGMSGVAALHAINTTTGTIALVADPESIAPGTPFYETGTAPNTVLNVEVAESEPLASTAALYSLSVPDMGERYGSAATVIGSVNYEWPHWYTTREIVWPQQTSGAQLFFACDVDFNGKNYKALSWGLMASNGSMPVGCFTTVLKKKYDIEVPCLGKKV